jgi:hypothetical protein
MTFGSINLQFHIKFTKDDIYLLNISNSIVVIINTDSGLLNTLSFINES